MCLSVAFASTAMRLPIGEKKGEKWRLFRMQASRYFLFLSISTFWRHFSGDFFQLERESVFTTHMSWILSLPLCQRPQIMRYPFFFDVLFYTGRLLRSDPKDWAFPYCTARPGWTSGLSPMWKGVKALLERLATPSQRSFWSVVISPPLLQSNAWYIDNFMLQPSHRRSGRYMP